MPRHDAYLAARGSAGRHAADGDLRRPRPAGHGSAARDGRLGRDDVTVVGYDGIPITSHPLVSLTTVDQFGVEMGATAIEFLMDRIRDGQNQPQNR